MITTDWSNLAIIPTCVFSGDVWAGDGSWIFSLTRTHRNFCGRVACMLMCIRTSVIDPTSGCPAAPRGSCVSIKKHAGDRCRSVEFSYAGTLTCCRPNVEPSHLFAKGGAARSKPTTHTHTQAALYYSAGALCE